MPPRATVVHAIDGRIRLRIPELRGNARYFEAASDVLRRCPEVEQLSVNSTTGSILVVHRGPTSDILDFAREHRLFEIAEAADLGLPSERLGAAVDSITDRVDRSVRQATRNSGDLRVILFLALAAASAIQFVRGHVLPAGIVLAAYAMAVLPSRGGARQPG
jgi:GAF domain-containing protein